MRAKPTPPGTRAPGGRRPLGWRRSPRRPGAATVPRHEMHAPSRKPPSGRRPTAAPGCAWRATPLVVVLPGWPSAARRLPRVGRLCEVQQNDNTRSCPPVGRVDDGLRADRGVQPQHLPALLVVIERPEGLTPADQAGARRFIAGVPQLTSRWAARRSGPTSRGRRRPPSRARTARRCWCRWSSTPTRPTRSWADSTVLFGGAAALRASAKQTLARLRAERLRRPGPVASLADFVTAFGGIDGILLGVALGVVFLILLIVYRSPILPFAVLLTAVFGLAAGRPRRSTRWPGTASSTLNGQSQGILSILVVGAATDYALLLVARYREELHDHESKWEAMRRGLAGRGGADRGQCGDRHPGAAVPAALPAGQHPRARPGRRDRHRRRGRRRAHLPARRSCCCSAGGVFWPLVPRVDHVHAEDAVGSRGVWGRVAGMVGRAPAGALGRHAARAPGPRRRSSRRSGPTASPSPSCSSTRSSRSPARRCSPATSRPASGSPVQIVVDQDRADAVVATVKRDADVSEAAVASAGPGDPAEGRRRQGAGAGHAAHRRPTARPPRRSSPGCGASSTRSARTCWSAAARPPTSTSGWPASATCG